MALVEAIRPLTAEHEPNPQVEEENGEEPRWAFGWQAHVAHVAILRHAADLRLIGSDAAIAAADALIPAVIAVYEPWDDLREAVDRRRAGHPPVPGPDKIAALRTEWDIALDILQAGLDRFRAAAARDLQDPPG